MTSALRKRCEEAAARLMVDDNANQKRLVNGPDWWWEDHAKSTIADAIEAEAKRFAEAVLRRMFVAKIENWSNDPDESDGHVSIADTHKRLREFSGCGCCGRRSRYGSDAAAWVKETLDGIVAEAIKAAEGAEE